MQTFLPYPDFKQSARVLDRQRLGKQRVEAKQIIMAMDAQTGWSNHPATRMWIGYRPALAAYGAAVCREWISRGYRDSLLGWFESLMVPIYGVPGWFGDELFHRSHRSNLVRKLPEHYGVLWPGVPDDLPYVWPS